MPTSGLALHKEEDMPIRNTKSLIHCLPCTRAQALPCKVSLPQTHSATHRLKRVDSRTLQKFWLDSSFHIVYV